MGARGQVLPRPWSAWLGAATLMCAAAALFLVLHPYAGLVHDARIYLGRGVADGDPLGVGQDLIFRDDAQTGFSLLRWAIDVVLRVATPPSASMGLALAGSLLWTAACVSLVRRLSTACLGHEGRHRAAWAMAVAVAALPSHYGAFGVFSYAESIATPRVFAEAAALGGLSALIGGRRSTGAGLLLLASALHPIMAAPALGVAAVVAARGDRRWLLAMALAACGVLLAAAAGLRMAERLFSTLDPLWMSALRQRSAYLFPTLWPPGDLAAAAPQAAAIAIAGAFATARARRALWSVVGVALVGVASTLLFGDWIPDTLVVQLQPWRALWLLAVFGNASFALALLALARRGAPGRLVGAVMLLSWTGGSPTATVLLSAAAVALCVAAERGRLARVSSGLVAVVVALACAAVVVSVIADARALQALLRSAAGAGGEVTWAMAATAGVQSLSLTLAAILIAARWSRFTRPALAGVALLAASTAACILWDQRTTERRSLEGGAGAAELRDFFAPSHGAVLWIDDAAETWFVLGRPAFFNALQGAPALFSRDVAYDWASRATALQRLGLVRPSQIAPWTSTGSALDDLRLTPEAIQAFCADPRRPAGLVAPGDQAGSVPPGFGVRVWRPSFSIRRPVVEDDGIAWRRIEAFTAVRCG